MIRTFSITILFSFAILQSPLYADTLILKNGKQIESSSCWEEGDQIRCKLYGQIIGYPKSEVANCRIERPAEKPVTGFIFDIWQSGISVMEAIKIAEINNKPFIKSGLISTIKEYHPNTCVPYADNTTKFYYKDQIFGRTATLNFEFTPESKRLHTLDVVFTGPGISKESEFRNQVESVLKKRYGNNPRYSQELFFHNFTWVINNNAIVVLRLSGNTIRVIYSDNRFVQMMQDEKLEQERKAFNKSDKTKF